MSDQYSIFFGVLLWAGMFFLTYTYLLYPAVIIALGRKGRYNTLPAAPNLPDKPPRVGVLISAFNEEKVLRATLEHLLKSDYPSKKLDIFVGSDCSTDATNDILEEMAAKHPKQLHILLRTQRGGKASVVNALAEMATRRGVEVFVFADANTLYEKASISTLVAPLIADPSIGGVGGNLLLHDTKEIAATGNKERDYWQYETAIKKGEGALGILIGSNGGGIYCLRSHLYSPLPTGISFTDDLYEPVRVVEQGYACVFEERAVAHEDVAPALKGEYRRKVRINSGAWNTFASFRQAKYPFSRLGWAMYSHKVIRWLTPLWLVWVAVGSWALAAVSLPAMAIAAGSLLFLVATLAGAIGIALRLSTNPFAPFVYFTLSVVALAHGFVQFVSRSTSATWSSTARLEKGDSHA